MPILLALAWLKRHWPIVLGSLVVLGCSVGYVWAGVTTIPPVGRHASICAALNADDDCLTQEVAHLRGVVTLVAYDPVVPGDPWLPIFAIVRIKGRAIALPLSAASEAALRAVVDDPRSDYRDLLIGAAAWPDLRALAQSEGVPIVQDAQRLLSPKVLEQPDDAMATTRVLRVRIALVMLR